MRIMYVANFKSRAFTGKTTWSESRHTALMRHLRKRISLIHELGKLVCSKECIDYTRYSPCINKIGRPHFFIMNAHAFTDGSGHTSETNIELLCKLLSNRADTTVS